nr:palmitoyltransferase pfa5 [Quercus suber]
MDEWDNLCVFDAAGPLSKCSSTYDTVSAMRSAARRNRSYLRTPYEARLRRSPLRHVPPPRPVRQRLDLFHLHGALDRLIRQRLHHRLGHQIRLQRLRPARAHQPRQIPARQAIRQEPRIRQRRQRHREPARPVVQEPRPHEHAAHSRERARDPALRLALRRDVPARQHRRARRRRHVRERAHARLRRRARQRQRAVPVHQLVRQLAVGLAAREGRAGRAQRRGGAASLRGAEGASQARDHGLAPRQHALVVRFQQDAEGHVPVAGDGGFADAAAEKAITATDDEFLARGRGRHVGCDKIRACSTDLIRVKAQWLKAEAQPPPAIISVLLVSHFILDPIFCPFLCFQHRLHRLSLSRLHGHQADMAAGATGRNLVSIITARVIPVLLFLIVGYVSYVIVGPLSINYLIHPPDGVTRRLVAGIAIPVAWGVLLIPTAVAWVRLCLVVMLDPGYVPQTDHDWVESAPPPPGLEEFYNRDVFVCDAKGLPIWCRTCRNWKPDRAHHNQDVGRCTMKMDHFCPWVGGVVGERSLKFFLQFLTYGLVLSTYGMILLAYFVHEARSRQIQDTNKVQMIVGLGLAGFFVLFTLGMVANSLNMIFRNVTSIESISMGPTGTGKILLAVLLPPEIQGSVDALQACSPTLQSSPCNSMGGESEQPLTSDLDDPSHARYFSKETRQRPQRHPSQSKHWKGTVTYPLNLCVDRPPLPAPIYRTFAILETMPGSIPWDLGSSYRNFTAVMGTRLIDWLLPIRHSPCCDHSSFVSQYPLGPAFEQLLHESGLVEMAQSGMWQPDHGAASRSSRKSRRKKRRLAQGWQNGERPDGWISEKEARRQLRLMEGRTGDLGIEESASGMIAMPYCSRVPQLYEIFLEGFWWSFFAFTDQAAQRFITSTPGQNCMLLSSPSLLSTLPDCPPGHL